jgi:hypothetical protein
MTRFKQLRQQFASLGQGGSSRLLILIAGFLLVLMLTPAISTAFSQPPAGGHWDELRSIPAADLGLSQPVGLSYSPAAGLFFALEGKDNKRAAELAAFTPFEDPAGRHPLAMAASQPLNTAFYEPTGELLALNEEGQALAQVEIGPDGTQSRSSQATRQFSASALRIADPQGMAVDANGGQLYVLDAAGPRIIRIQAGAQHSFDGETAARDGRVQRIRLRSLENVALRGIAFNPSDGHLYIGSPAQQKLYEVTGSGHVVAVYDLGELNLRDSQGMVFAPSADRTDDPDVYHLYLADSGLSGVNANNGHIVELSFEQPAVQARAAMAQASLANTIDTSKASWNPSSPDPAGIAYRPATSGLFITDSEVEENHPDYEGYNVFESTTGGTLVDLCSTTDYSGEPTGAAVNPANGRIYSSNDFREEVYEVNLGADGAYCTNDDTLATLEIRSIYPEIADAEGLAFGNNKLFVSDGTNREVYIIDLGADGVIGGTGTNADTASGHFDTQSLGLNDPEGIEYNPDSGTLFVVSTKKNDTDLQEVTQTGAVVTTYDLGFLGADTRRSGLAYGPGSSHNPGAKSVYIASRGVDNDDVKTENDGKVFEIALGPPGPTLTPSVTATTSGTPTATSTATSSATATATTTSTATATATTTATGTATATATAGPSSTPTVTVTGTPPTPTSTSTPSATPTDGPSPTPTATATPPPNAVYIPVNLDEQ